MKPIYNQTINRKRINQQLEYIFYYPLTVVHAPSGYGKTTAVQQFLKEKKVSSVWTTITNHTSYTSYFWERLTAQISKQHQQFGRQMQSLGFPNDASTTAKIINMISSKEIKKPLIIVIDDYHMAKDLQLYNLINVIVQEKITNLHIVIITRDLSLFDVSEFYQKHLCFTISQNVLKFDYEEIKEYLYLMNHKLSDNEIKKISEFTNGWVALIYLLVQGIEEELEISTNRPINDLVERNLYNNYDHNTKEFLLKISFLDSFTISQANYVLNVSNTSQILKPLLEKNAFIIYDEFSKAYKIHHLLLGFLREKAKEENIYFTNLSKRCGEWFLKNGNHMKAFDYLYKAGDIETILKELNKENMTDIHFTQFTKIYQIFEGLDEELCFKYPLAYLRYIRVFALSGDYKAIKQSEQYLINLERYFEKSDLDSRYKDFILGEINIIWTFVVFNDLKKMIYHNKKAMKYFSGGCSCIVTRNKEMSFGSPHLLYTYYKEKGKFKETAQFIADNFYKLALVSDGCGTGSDSLALAEYALETGDFDNVELNAYKSIYKAQTHDQLSIEICANFALQRLTIIQGKFDEGLEMATSMKKQIEKQNNPVLNTTFELCDAYLDCCLQRFNNIPDWIKNGEITSASFMYQGMAFVYIVYGKVILLSGNYVQLDALCETFDNYFSIYNNQLGFIHNYIHKAVAQYKLNDLQASKNTLMKALEIGQADNIIMPFAENATFILDILKEVQQDQILNKNYMQRILSCTKKYHENITKSNMDIIYLTNREKEVLKLLESGYKHEEISNKLFISVTTVRFHIKNIYQKMEVNNKIIALKKA
ncbi:MAG: LuxR C-terminal-related transcriptional regulator, partial [Bacillota bacterium]